jgi:hypothetical protein
MMPSQCEFLRDHRPCTRRAPAAWAILLVTIAGGLPKISAADTSPGAQKQKSKTVPQRVSLSPRFVPGQSFRYAMEFETTTATTRSGLASDPQGPSRWVLDWNSTVRTEVLPAGADAPGGIRLRSTYEKSTATIRSDTFDPAADETREKYQKLEGKVIEFTLDGAGKVKSVLGLEGFVDEESSARSAREWIAQISASAGAPPGGVSVGETWVSEQPASSLPLDGLVWRSDSQYLRNEPCHPPNPDLPSPPAVADSNLNVQAMENCAVILTNLALVRAKMLRDATPEEYRASGVQSEGKWTGSGESLTYVSLATGLVVSVTQTESEEMDVTLKTSHGTSIHYAGTIASRSQVALVMDDASGK